MTTAPKTATITRKPKIQLRLGDWRSALLGLKRADVILTDPPYSARTCKGQRTGSSTAQSTTGYDAFTEDDAYQFAKFCVSLDPWWVIIFSDHVAQRWHEAALLEQGFYAFAPLPWVKHPPPPRMCGDGPTCAAEMVTVARQRKRLGSRAGSRPGWYKVSSRPPEGRGSGVAGVKCSIGMSRLILDYTEPGDLIVDPFAGLGTTLAAAMMQGRHAIGSEIHAPTFRKAAERLSGLRDELRKQR